MGNASPAARRLAALALVAVAVAAVLALAALPFWLVHRREAEIAALDARARELNLRLPLRDRLRDKEQEMARSANLDDLLMRGATPAIAAAALQGALISRAQALNVTVSSVQSIEPEADDSFTRVGLRLAVSGRIDALRDFLYALETQMPVLIVDEMALAASERPDAADSAPELTGTLAVHGWQRPTAAPPPPASPLASG